MRSGRFAVEDEAVTDEKLRRTTAEQVASLIELGLDREAAEVGAAVGRDQHQAGVRSQPTGNGGGMDVLAQLDQLGPVLGNVVQGITTDQLDNPTPCSKFTVRGVLEHMIGGATMFAAGFRGQAPPVTADPTGGEVLDQFEPVLTDLVVAMHEPGALDRTIQAPFGEVPGSEFARFVVLDGLVHGWDLATATGQRYDPPAGLVADVDSYARKTLGPLRDGDTFAAEVEAPADATPIERLASFTGRQIIGGRS
jgi:uncharacterized protein (TIGR03086 family)